MHAVFAGDWFELGELLQAGVARNFVAGHGDRLVGLVAVGVEHRRIDRNDLGFEAALGHGYRSSFL